MQKEEINGVQDLKLLHRVSHKIDQKDVSNVEKKVISQENALKIKVKDKEEEVASNVEKKAIEPKIVQILNNSSSSRDLEAASSAVKKATELVIVQVKLNSQEREGVLNVARKATGQMTAQMRLRMMPLKRKLKEEDALNVVRVDISQENALIHLSRENREEAIREIQIWRTE